MSAGEKRLRSGYTTGTCAAAAAKAAAWMLLMGKRRESVSVCTPGGGVLTLMLQEVSAGGNTVSCAVRKDAGDDPDVTDGIVVFARVSRTETPGVYIDGGAGVGRVTRPGLDQPVGAAAINSVPRQMIRESVEEVCRLTEYRGGLSVLISVPGGEELAKKTFNPRLGIEGGISILGTTGIVEPMSTRALVETIRAELRQRHALGARDVLLTPGNYGADFIRQELGLDPAAAVMTSNFIGEAVDICASLGFRSILLVGHIGKLVKLAGGIFNTHSRYGDCRMELLTALAAVCGLHGAAAAELMDCVSCEDALRVLERERLCGETLRLLTARVTEQLRRRCGDGPDCGVILFSRAQGLLGESENARTLLRQITEE